jgi:hypothetical protein
MKNKVKVEMSRLDAAENFFFERELESVKARSYDVKYPELKARTLIPVDNSEDPAADTVKYEQYDRVGVAKFVSSYSTDFPRVDVKGKEFRSAIKSIGDSFGYSVMEIRKAKMANKPLEQRKANAARKAVEEQLDTVAAIGNDENGLLGLLNQPNALGHTIAAGVSTDTEWSEKTPDEIIKDFTDIVNYMRDQTKGVEAPDTVLIPDAQYGIIATTPRSALSDTTILDFILKTNPWIRSIEPWFKLKGAGALGVDRMVAYKRDPDALQLIIPQEFEQFPPEQKGMEFEVVCHMRTGGVVAYYPLSICYGDGI